MSKRVKVKKQSDVPKKVYKLFNRLTIRVIEAGWKHYSADAVLHAIRWHMHIEQGDREFKCNNNWTSHLARWFHGKHPEHSEFFRTRSSPRVEQ